MWAQFEILLIKFLQLIIPDEESPLYEVSARDISTKMQFEIILTVEGITPETGNTIQVISPETKIEKFNFHQVRTSYLPNEILWGYRFEHSCVAYDQKAAKYVVSVNNLNKVKSLTFSKLFLK